MDSGRRERSAILWILSAVFVWGLGYPLGKAYAICISEATGKPFGIVGAAATGAVRFLIAAITVWIALPAARARPTRAEVIQGMFMGAVIGGAIPLFQYGLAVGLASTVAFLSQMYLVFVVIAVQLISRRFPSRRVVLAVAMALTGSAVLSGLSLGAFRIDASALPVVSGAALAAVQIMILDAPRYGQNRPEPVTFVMFLTMGLALLGSFVLPEGVVTLHALIFDPACRNMTAFLSTVMAVYPFLTITRHQKSVPAIKATMVYVLEPVIASASVLFLPGLVSKLLGMNYPNERWTPQLLIGAALILGGNLALSFGGEQRRDT